MNVAREQEWNNFFWDVLILSKQLDSSQQLLIEEKPAYLLWKANARYHETRIIQNQGSALLEAGGGFFIYLDSHLSRSSENYTAFWNIKEDQKSAIWNEFKTHTRWASIRTPAAIIQNMITDLDR